MLQAYKDRRGLVAPKGVTRWRELRTRGSVRQSEQHVERPSRWSAGELGDRERNGTLRRVSRNREHRPGLSGAPPPAPAFHKHARRALNDGHCSSTGAHEIQCPERELSAVEMLVAHTGNCSIVLRRDLEDVLGVRHQDTWDDRIHPLRLGARLWPRTWQRGLARSGTAGVTPIAVAQCAHCPKLARFSNFPVARAVRHLRRRMS